MISRRLRADRWPLAGAALLAFAVGIAYVVLARHTQLAGDQIDYDTYGRLATQGHWFWLDEPYGTPRPSAWKPPSYPAWMGFWYSILGAGASRTQLVQTALMPLTVVLTWWLAGTFSDDRRVRLGAAFVVAVYPMAWQYTGLLYSEALAIPLSILVLAVGFRHAPTNRRAAAVGALIGLNLLVRPSAFFLMAGVLAAWWVTDGFRQAVRAGVISVAVAALVIAPSAVRNAHTLHAFIPLSVQDAAVYGTFNPLSASDTVYPWAWRPFNDRDRDLLDPKHPLPEPELRDRLKARAYAYIRAHPSSVPKAFFWNGLSRLWDVRRPARALNEVRFEGRVRGVAIAALAFYYVLAPLALVGLWSLRRRRDLLVGVVTMGLVASIAFTVDSGTRYRAPMEPVIVVLAGLGAAAIAGAWRDRRARPGLSAERGP